MVNPTRKREKIRRSEFGDFQTPQDLATQCCKILDQRKTQFKGLLEPSCGKGSMLIAALQQFQSVESALGVEINENYIERAKESIHRSIETSSTFDILQSNIFKTDWESMIRSLPEPLLIFGNPPWVTNSTLSRLNSKNQPKKQNDLGFSGMDAMTGKSNFDVAEWLIMRLIEASPVGTTIGMLCKTSVARKILSRVWKAENTIEKPSIYPIDSSLHFSASVDAAFFLFELAKSPKLSPKPKTCKVFQSLENPKKDFTIGHDDSRLIANVEAYRNAKRMVNRSNIPVWGQWRSGIKHDCSAVMELALENDELRNGFGETVEIEELCLYPMLKSSDVAQGRTRTPHRFMIVPQKSTGEDTALLKKSAPLTFKYLQSKAEILNNRKSSVYANRPSFSVFGIGEYSFARWKVAVSGFYNTFQFRVVGLSNKKPIVLDDTCYFMPCRSRKQASLFAELLNSDSAREFFKSFVFQDSKRPITSSLLHSLDLRALAVECNKVAEFDMLCPAK